MMRIEVVRRHSVGGLGAGVMPSVAFDGLGGEPLDGLVGLDRAKPLTRARGHVGTLVIHERAGSCHTSGSQQRQPGNVG